MLDLDALEFLDTALPVNSDNAPAHEHLHVVEIVQADASHCPHLAGLAAE